MPNWVRNHLTITGANASSVLKDLLVENTNSNCGYDFDFNKIKPMPEPLNIVSGSETNTGLNLYLTSINPAVIDFGDKKLEPKDFSEAVQAITKKKSFIHYSLSKKEIEKLTKYSPMEKLLTLGEQAFKNFINYGAIDWYDWCCANWGTKWNACETYVSGDKPTDVYFDTAWSPITDLIRELSIMYPDCSFAYEYAEEQAGYFAGDFTFKNGSCLNACIYHNFTKEAYEKYFELWGGEDYYKLNSQTDTYEYIEDEGEM